MNRQLHDDDQEQDVIVRRRRAAGMRVPTLSRLAKNDPFQRLCHEDTITQDTPGEEKPRDVCLVQGFYRYEERAVRKRISDVGKDVEHRR